VSGIKDVHVITLIYMELKWEYKSVFQFEVYIFPRCILLMSHWPWCSFIADINILFQTETRLFEGKYTYYST